MRRLVAVLVGVLTVALAACAEAGAAAPGINLQNDVGPAAAQRAVDLGAREVRLFVDWRDFEPDGPGTFPAVRSPQAAQTYANYVAALQVVARAHRRVMLVVTDAPGWANGHPEPGGGAYGPTPAHRADYAAFVAALCRDLSRRGIAVDELEVWNEPDGGLFWLPRAEPAAYTALLRTTYRRMKDPRRGAPSVKVFAGPTVANDYPWLAKLYAHGAKGSFDGVSVHTDTACSVADPGSFFRDAGRISQYTFLGYREVHATMRAHGDGSKPIAMSELGWASTGGGPTSCHNGVFASKKPSGVDEATQAAFLTRAYGCLARDRYVTIADWFQLEDGDEASPLEGNHYGLLAPGGVAKPALAAWRDVVASGGRRTGPCGDFTAPRLVVSAPRRVARFGVALALRAVASDPGGVGVARVTFAVDGHDVLTRRATGAPLDGRVVALHPWRGARRLRPGAHTVTVLAVDRNGNRRRVAIRVRRVA